MRVTLRSYPTGIRGTRFTIDRMREMVHKGKINPEVLQAASLIVRNIPGKDYYAEAEAIYEFVKTNIRYTRDPHNVELIQAANITLQRGQGDCDDHVCLVCALAGAVGLPCGVETIKCDPNFPNDFSHVYPIIKTNRGWRAADTTVFESNFGWRPPAHPSDRKIWLM